MYLYNVPLCPSRPAALVFYIRCSCILIWVLVMLKGIGIVWGAAPSVNACYGRGYGSGNRVDRCYSHVSIVCMVESVFCAGSRSFQKLAGFRTISCLAHFVKLSICFVFA